MKTYDYQTFRVNRTTEIECWTEDTRYGFRHLAELRQDGRVIGNTKACYYNRTWEAYEYQSVIHALIDKSDMRNKRAAKKRIDDKALGRVRDSFKTISAVMAIGDIMAPDQAAANDWKLRMLKAGIGEYNLSVPEDWDRLDEAEKQRRLDNVVELFQKG